MPASRSAGRTAELAIACLEVAAATVGVVGRRARRGHALGRLETGDDLGLELLAAVTFDVKNLAAVTELGKRHGQAVAAGAAGAAGAVRVVLGLHGQAGGEGVGDGGDVDAAG